MRMPRDGGLRPPGGLPAHRARLRRRAEAREQCPLLLVQGPSRAESLTETSRDEAPARVAEAHGRKPGRVVGARDEHRPGAVAGGGTTPCARAVLGLGRDRPGRQASADRRPCGAVGVEAANLGGAPLVQARARDPVRRRRVPVRDPDIARVVHPDPGPMSVARDFHQNGRVLEQERTVRS